MKIQYIEYLSNDSLPESVRQSLPDDHTQDLFRASLNSHLRDGKTEMHAYIKAYRFLEEAGFERKEGKWVAKEGPTVGDVHVDAPLGSGSGTPKQRKPKSLETVPNPAPAEIFRFEKRISGSSSIPLNSEGRKLADELGARIKQKGGLDVLHASPLRRGQQTAEAIAKHNPEMKVAEPNPALQPWHLGEIEGQDGGDAKARIAYYIEHPAEVPPGKGADGKPAESFNTAKKRQLDFWSGVIKDSKDHPTAKIGVVAHSRGVELLQAWVDAGCPEDYDLDEKDLLHPDDPEHASVLRLHKDHIDEVPVDEDDELKPGIYVILHSLTDDDGDKGNEELEKKYLPPVEVHKAASMAHEAGFSVLDITAPLAKSEGLTEAGVRKIAEHFAANLAESPISRDAWGGAFAAKWADRVIRKIEKDRIEKAGNGVMVAFWPDPEVAKKLAIDGGEKPEELHVTLAYLGKLDDIQKLPALENALQSFAAAHGSVSGSFGGPGRFPATPHSDGKDVAYASFESSAIQEFRADLVEAIEAAGLSVVKNFGYTPHMTLAYIAPGADLPVQRIEPVPVTFGTLGLSIGGARKEYPLSRINDYLDADKRQVAVTKLETRLAKSDLDTPLLLRLLEFVRENEMPDEALHLMAERIEQLAGDKPLGMDAYEKIIAGIDAQQTEKRVDVEMVADIVAKSEDRQLVFGWASIVAVNGVPVTDSQGDQITIPQIETTCYQYVLSARLAGEMHGRDANNQPIGIGRLVESVMFTDEKQRAMIDSLNQLKIMQDAGVMASMSLNCTAWWVGFFIEDISVWRRVVAGELRAFSIGGTGDRVKLGN